MTSPAHRLVDAPETATRRPFLVKTPERLSPSEKLVYTVLSKNTVGNLLITSERGTTRHFGERSSKLRAHVIVRDSAFFDRVAMGGSLALGESYVDGLWEVEDDKLCDFLGILLTNHLFLTFKQNFWQLIGIWLRAWAWNTASLSKAKRCVQAHYDLSNDFFALFLDRSMAYSCGYELEPGDSLEQMQEQKFERICKKLCLERGGTLLDVGCGWGGLLIYAAQHYPDIKAVGITISQRQFELARKRVMKEGLDQRVQIRLEDYRETSGTFDYLVSVGMFEHVGLKNTATFMQQIKRLLKPDGIGLLHTIGLTDEPGLRPDPWISKYVFPGSRLPRLHELVRELESCNLAAVHVENWKLHYAQTLRHWKNNFDRNQAAIRALDKNFNDRFLRLWNYYLQCCEASFRYSTVQLYQILFNEHESWNVPMCLRY